MAEAIGIAILSSVLGGTATGGVAATVVGSIALAGVSIGTSLIANTLEKTPSRDKQQAVLNEAIAARRRVYGQAMLGGTRFFWDARNGQLNQGIVLCEGEIDSIIEYWIGDQRVTTDGGNLGGTVQDAPWTGKIFFEGHFGSESQPASATLLNLYPDIWTAQHQLKGLAYVVVVFQGVSQAKQNKIYPQGYATQLRFVVKGAKVWDVSGGEDPSDPTTWAWRDSSALCILDYLRHADGMRLPLARIDVPSFTDFHALCAEQVARRDGTMEARYRCWGAYGLDEAPKDVLARMCATCDGTLVQGPTGLVGIRGGRYRAPLVAINTSAIVTADLSQGSDKLDAYNRLKVTYTDPDNYYQATELQARDDLPAQAQVGVQDHTFDIVMAPSWTQAARVAKMRFAQDNPDWRGTLATHLSALEAVNQDVAHVTYDPVPDVGAMVDADCVLTSFSIKGDGSGCELGFVSVAASTWNWDPALEEPPRPVTPQVIVYEDTVDAPTQVAATQRTGTQIVDLTWAAPTRSDASPTAQYRPHGQPDTAFLPMTMHTDNVSAEIGPLGTGNYDFRVQFTAGGTPSNWTEVDSVQVT